MKIVKQKESLPVMNLDSYVGDEINHLQKRHGSLLPKSIRSVICGPSNCGKSNLMLTLLFDPKGLKFENIYVYSKSLYQPKYEFLKEVMHIPKMGYYAYKENDEILSPADAKQNSIFIFDDVACDGQEKIREYFSMSRHMNVDCFYLCQTYTRIPKHLLRDNASLIILFKQDDLNLKHVFNDHVSSDMTFEKFKHLCTECWKDKYGFLTIDKENDLDDGRYRKNLDQYIML